MLLLVEDGVDFPRSNLDADREWIPFNRHSVYQISTRLVAMINHFIAEKIPAPPPAAQVAAPEETAEQPPAPPDSDLFNQAVALLDEGNFSEADAVFQRYLGSLGSDPFERWLSYYYLRLKSVRGHKPSLLELKDLVRREPGNVEVRVELARYYEKFNEFAEASRILQAGVSAADGQDRPRLQRRLAIALAQSGAFDAAIRTIGQLALTDHSDDIEPTFTILADVAKLQGDKILEASALERALRASPGDSNLRFRLAYLYNQGSQDRLALYHYNLRLAQAEDSATQNNLGVAYAALKLTGREVEMFLASSSSNALAKANLSHAYIDRGFLAAADTLASEATSESSDDLDRQRAASALRRIGRKRSEEKDREEAILRESKAESAFRGEYAVAFVAPAGKPIHGIFSTPRGELSFSQDGSLLLGEGTERVPVKPGLLVGLTAVTPTEKVKKLHFEATLTGRSGRFKLTITGDSQGKTLLASLVSSSLGGTSPVEGLIVAAEDGESFEVLEEEGGVATLYKAVRKANSG